MAWKENRAKEGKGRNTREESGRESRRGRKREKKIKKKGKKEERRKSERTGQGSRAKFGILVQILNLCTRTKFCLDRFILSPCRGINHKCYYLFNFKILWLRQSSSVSQYMMSMMDRQTHTQRNQHFLIPSGMRSSSPTKLSVMIEDLEHVLASRKRSLNTLWNIHIVSLLESTKELKVT